MSTQKVMPNKRERWRWRVGGRPSRDTPNTEKAYSAVFPEVGGNNPPRFRNACPCCG